jgi:tight adherence protein B
MRIALVVLTSLALLGLLEAAFQTLRYLSDRRGHDLRRRLQAHDGPLPLDSSLLKQGRFSGIPALDAWLSTRRWARRIEHLLEQADSRMTVAQLCGFSLLGAFLGAMTSWWLGLVGLAIAGAALVAPVALLVAARERRSRILSEQLPEALDMMARSLRAGHALSSAFQLVAEEMPEPICVEFARAFEEQRLGMPLERAVREMGARAPSNGDLKLFAVSTLIQKETGGNLAEILDGIATTVRDRYRFFGRLRALTAEARVSAWLVALMPIGIAVFMVVTQPDYMGKLVDNALGQTILAVGVGSWILGTVWFQRLTRFDY